jgi:transposase
MSSAAKRRKAKQARQEKSREIAAQQAAARREEAKGQRERLAAHARELIGQGDSDGAVKMMVEVVEKMEANEERLLERIKALMIMVFGRRSEKLSKEELGQLALAFGCTPEEASKENPDTPVDRPDPEAEPPEPSESSNPSGGRKKKRRHRGRTKLSDELERDISEIVVPESERQCVHCGSEMKPIGHVDSETVVYIPAKIIVRVQRREKIACKKCYQDICVADPEGQPEHHGRKDDETAPAVNHRADASLLAYLIESKCDDALPIYRQQDQLSRLGFHVPCNTLYGYWNTAAALLVPIAQVTLSTVLGSDIVAADDTRLDFLKPDKKTGIKRGHLWGFEGEEPLIAFDFQPTWRAEDIAPRLTAITGIVQCDDYKGYSSEVQIGQEEWRPLVFPEKRLGCMMHVRRRFFKAWNAGECDARIIMNYIQQIYQIEAKAKEKGLSPPDRLALRQSESLPLLNTMYAWLEKYAPTFRPTSYMGKAAGYALQQKQFIYNCFKDDGRFEIDNGRIERAIRDIAIGRKNYLFAGSVEGAHRLAAAYTIVCSCRKLMISTRDYLLDVLPKMAAGFPLRLLNDLRPDNWARSRGLLKT